MQKYKLKEEFNYIINQQYTDEKKNRCSTRIPYRI